jgi:hypothetical protein
MGRVIYQPIKKTITASSQTGSVNSDPMNGEIIYLYVKATSSDTEFDFQIIDPDNRILRSFVDEIEYIRSTEILPVNGIHTLKVLNSSADEAFDVLIKVRELS